LDTKMKFCKKPLKLYIHLDFLHHPINFLLALLELYLNLKIF